MNVQSIGIPIAFVILASLIVWFIIAGKGYWFLKIPLVLVACYFTFCLWSSLGSLVGWACDEELPEVFLIHWIVIQEDNKTTKEKGKIFIWLTELDENHEIKNGKNSWFIDFGFKKKNEPRAYRLKYSPESHETMDKILGKIKLGKPIIGKKKKPNGEGKNGSFNFSLEQDYMFYDLPPPKLSEKIHENLK